MYFIRLIDPKTEIPLWDKETMDLLRNATSIAEAKIVDNRMREIMVQFECNTIKLYFNTI